MASQRVRTVLAALAFLAWTACSAAPLDDVVLLIDCTPEWETQTLNGVPVTPLDGVELYLGARFLGVDRATIRRSNVLRDGIEVTSSGGLPSREADVLAMLRTVGVDGDRSRAVGGPADWQFVEVPIGARHPGALRLGRVELARPGGVLDSFLLVIAREDDAALRVALLRGRHPSGTLVMTGHGARGAGRDEQGNPRVEFAPSFQAVDLPLEWPGQEVLTTCWIAQFEAGRDLPRAF